ncbi:YciI family protein [Pseudonocardia nigra]|uniref:YciI family protein n=1 Tax=Pseudonocardia nigra TaxID=1921578 RepID=UPI001C5ECB10|nr:YciI family protein [Pseudonocardia nigra]
MRYMLLIYGCEHPDPGTPEHAAKIAAVQSFTAQCAADGVLLAADRLHDTDTATTMRVRDGEALVTDGPFAETAEHLGGYYLLECRDLDEALGYAARCPMAAEGCIEVRPVVEAPMPPVSR